MLRKKAPEIDTRLKFNFIVKFSILLQSFDWKVDVQKLFSKK